MDKSLILQLGSGQWLRDGLNLIIGEVKTWLACVLAHNACRYPTLGNAILDRLVHNA